MERQLENIDYKQAYKELLKVTETLTAKKEDLEFQLAQLKRLVFGSRHEKFIAASGAPMPILFDLPPIDGLLETSTTTVTYEKTVQKTRTAHPGRNSFPAHLRREERIINPIGVDPALAKKISEDVTETLAYVPAELYVKKVIRPKYQDLSTKTIHQAEAPYRSFERSNVDPSLIAHIIADKFVDHLPLDRQLKRFARLGVTISDSTIGNWVAASAAFLQPLYEVHKQLVLSSKYLHADETIIKVRDSDKKNATHQGYYWVYQCNANKLVLFDYRSGRGREGPRSVLADYKGYLQTDGYIVYEDFADHPDITVFHCMAHARRKFSEALANDKARAEYALSQIQKLYAVERWINDHELTGSDKRKYRKEEAMPILEKLGDWLKAQYPAVLPTSAIGKAIAYSVRRWEKLQLYATTDLLNIDNNPVENSIRPVAVGRKNYLFAGSHAAAGRSAIFYSLLATCKNYGLHPSAWLEDVLTRIAGHPINHIQELLPQNWKPRESR